MNLACFRPLEELAQVVRMPQARYGDSREQLLKLASGLEI